MKNAVLLFCFTILFYTSGLGQNNARADSSNLNSVDKSVGAASAELLASIQQNKSNEEIAKNYCDLAKALSSAQNFSKAEFYMNRAVLLESGSKSKNNLAEYYRELGKIQELENKNKIASGSYKKAAELSSDSLQKQLNQNDAIRLQQNSPAEQLQYANTNGILLSNTSNNSEKLQNYTQQANLNIAMNNNTVALGNYRDALNTVDGNTENSVLIKSDMVDLMAASQDYESAIALQKDVVNESKNNLSVETQVKQLRNLSELYFKIDSTSAGLAILQNAYELAVANGNLKEAKASLSSLAAYYEKNKEDKKSADLYRDFTSRLDNLIAKDSSLIDKNLFLATEEKITALQQQQLLKDELIKRKNRFDIVLIGSLVLLIALLLLISKAWFSIRKRNKQIALQSLRREMNPHFIFNSLNSVNQFIANNNELEANKYLTAYSNLMRNVMENSNKDYVSLISEVEQLKKYLELEKLRFPDKFDYEIEIDSSLNAEEVLVPNMIIQPNLENAIWHGLRYKEAKGLLKLKFQKQDAKTIVTIDDNGIGLTESKRIKTKNQKLHESLGLKNVQERIRLLNDIYKSGISFSINEKEQGGVIVQLEW